MGYEDELSKRIQKLLIEGCKHLGLQEDIKIVERRGYRLTIEYTQSPDHPDFIENMLKLEKVLQLAARRPIDLRLKAKNDKNKRFDRNYLRGVEKL